MSKRFHRFVFLGCMFLVLIVYGRGLNFDFVYDDHWRIETNPAITSLKNSPRFFFDNGTSSSNADLHGDNYRPLTMLSYAVDHAIFGRAPWGYRLQNFLWHGLAGFLVALLALQLFSVSIPAALLAAVVYLLHPVQVGVVVWLSERSSLMVSVWMLLGLICWPSDSSNSRRRRVSYLFFVLALLSREVAVVFPALVWIKEKLNPAEHRWSRGQIIFHGSLMASIVLFYLLVRSLVLGQLAMAGPWGANWVLNGANVVATTPLYVKTLLWPSFKLTYADLPVVTHLWDARFFSGLMLIISVGLLVAGLWKKEKRLALCLLSMIFLWMPGSNLVPLTTLFGERLVAPLLIFFCCVGAIVMDHVWAVWKTGYRYGWIFFLAIILGSRVAMALPAWKNDLTLWSHQTIVAPQSWFSWACLAETQYGIYQRSALDLSEEQRVSVLLLLEKNLIQSLRLKPPVDSFIPLLHMLSEIHEQQGKKVESLEDKRRAELLQKTHQP